MKEDSIKKQTSEKQFLTDLTSLSSHRKKCRRLEMSNIIRKEDEIIIVGKDEVKIDIIPLALPCHDMHKDSQEEEEDGRKRLRIVRPYPFTFKTFAKARWENRTILDVYHTEFASYPKCYYETAITEGRILVCGKRVDCDYPIRHGDELCHVVHRHEPAVAISPKTMTQSYGQMPWISIVYEDDSIMAVDKPPTMPIHPCGAYHWNSLIPILELQTSLKLHTVHRLDRLTSGLTILAKHKSTAQSLSKCISQKRQSCQKIYLLRVKGKFPLNAPPHRHLHLPSTTIRHNPIRNGEINNHVTPLTYKHSNNTTMSIIDNNCALGYWLEDNDGNVVCDNDNQYTLQSIFESQHSVDCILNAIIPTSRNHSKDQQSNNQTSSTILWFCLACPCQVKSFNPAICECGDDLQVNDNMMTNNTNHKQKKNGNGKNIKPAQTAFTVVEYDPHTDTTLVIARPITGRTHQIRLHTKYLGHVIANDPDYNNPHHDSDDVVWFGNPRGKDMCEKAKRLLRNSHTNKKSSLPVHASSTDVPAVDDEIQRQVIMQKRVKGESMMDYVKKTCVWCARSGKDSILLEYLIRSPGIWLHALQYTITSPDGKVSSYRTRDLPDWAQLRRHPPTDEYGL